MMKTTSAVFSCVFVTILCTFYFQSAAAKRSFEIDYANNQFLKDGQPFRYVSGEVHYFRVPREYWRDRLMKLKAAGLNVVSTYVEWSSHEPVRGVYDFVGDNDLETFVRLAADVGLLVILRPGPYICAERDLGGYPRWLLYENPNMYLRTKDPSHTRFVQVWLDVLMKRMQPLLYGNGGPIIMVQVENEYGSYTTCDSDYLIWLRDTFRSYVGSNAVLFTTDGFYSSFLKCTIPGVFITVDFGTGQNVSEAFIPLRRLQRAGPLVNSEFYPGWLTHWGEAESTVPTDGIVNTTRDMLAINASFNFFMFHGGTNFGFTAGANSPPFNPQITSYDYDAPITEAGDLTDKYFAIKSVISEFMTIEDLPVKNLSKLSYGPVRLEPKVSLFDSDVGFMYPDSVYPVTCEALQQYTGFMMYQTSLPPGYQGRGYLTAAGVHDRAIVFINKEPVGVLSRSTSSYSINIAGTAGQTLGLLVENQGHINYGSMFDLKGLTDNVTLDGVNLTGWKHVGYPLNNTEHIVNLTSVEEVKLPAFFSAQFHLPHSDLEPQDTFVNMDGWSKGVLFVNGHNLGRYWPVAGPQLTLYLPAPYLLKYPQHNTILVLELEKTHPNRTVEFVDEPIWSS